MTPCDERAATQTDGPAGLTADEMALAADVRFWSRLMADIRAYDRELLLEFIRQGRPYEQAMEDMLRIGRAKQSRPPAALDPIEYTLKPGAVVPTRPPEELTPV
jgi:hypothetical protein